MQTATTHCLDPDHAAADGSTALVVACAHKRHDCVRALLEYGANPTHCTSDGRTAMQVAREQKDTEAVKLLVGELRRGQELVGKLVEGAPRRQ